MAGPLDQQRYARAAEQRRREHGQQLGAAQAGLDLPAGPRQDPGDEGERHEAAVVEPVGPAPPPVAVAAPPRLRALAASGLNRPALRDAIASATGFTGAAGAIAWDNGGGNRTEPVLVVLPGVAREGREQTGGGNPW